MQVQYVLTSCLKYEGSCVNNMQKIQKKQHFASSPSKILLQNVLLLQHGIYHTLAMVSVNRQSILEEGEKARCSVFAAYAVPCKWEVEIYVNKLIQDSFMKSSLCFLCFEISTLSLCHTGIRQKLVQNKESLLRVGFFMTLQSSNILLVKLYILNVICQCQNKLLTKYKMRTNTSSGDQKGK